MGRMGVVLVWIYSRHSFNKSAVYAGMGRMCPPWKGLVACFRDVR